MKPDEETNQSSPASDETQRQKEQGEQVKKNWIPKSKMQIRVFEKMGMRLRVTRPDSESANIKA